MGPGRQGPGGPPFAGRPGSGRGPARGTGARPQGSGNPLERFFDQVLFTEQLGRDSWKPSPAGYQAIAERLGAEAQACAYVADNPAKDFVAANRLGWRTVQYLRPGQIHAHKPAPPDGLPQQIVHHAGELLGALR